MRKVILTLMVAFGFVLSASAQDRTITGRITDEKGAPVQGVSVTSSDRRNGTQTDANGNYRIVVSSSARTLTFSSVNFETKTASISGSTVNVSLTGKDNTLEEVAVNTGYGKIRKSQYSGASDRLGRAAVKNTPVASIDQQLQGKIPGLSVLSGSGQPGSSAAVVLRGFTSINGGTTPLYVIDGVPVEAGVFQSLNSNDIETIDVLKDATAQALYGSRGAAGVIVITTRRGSGDKMKLAVSSQFGYTQKPNSKYRMMNTTELLKAQEQLGVSANLQGNSTGLIGWNLSPLNPAYQAASAAQKAILDAQRDSVSKINTDWDDVFFRQGSFTRTDLTLSGGTGKTRLYSNLGYYKEQGITDRTDLKRYTWRNNADYTDNKLTASFSTTFGYTKRDFQESTTSNNLRNPFLAARLTPPTSRLWKAGQENSQDYINGLQTGTGNQFSGANLYQLNKLNYNYSDQIKALLSFTGAYKISRDFTINGLAGIDARQTQATFYSDPREFYNTSSADIRTKSGSITESLDRYLQYELRGGVTYARTFAGRHAVQLDGYTELIHRYTKFTTETAYGVDPKRPNTIAGSTQGSVANQLVATTGGSRSQRSIGSEMLIGRYTYNGKYTVNGTFRHDGSSQLPDDNRFNNFYSIGGVWEASRESFIKKIKFINNLRLRASYGTSANADNFSTNDFFYAGYYSLGNDGGGNPTQFIGNVQNDDLTWEFTIQKNVGVDFSVWKERVYGSVDLYDKKTVDALLGVGSSATTGFTQFTDNAATVRNKGVEWKVNFDVLRTKNATITLYANGSYNKNYVQDLGGLPELPVGTSLISVGKPLGSHWEVGWAGVEPASGRPMYYDKNGNVTYVYSTANRVQKWGTSFAPRMGGFGLNAAYKGFDLGVGFTYQQGSRRVNNLEFFVENPGSFLATGLGQAASLNFWKGPGDVNATTQSGLYAVNFSSKYIQDASFIKLKNVTFGYTVPQDLLKRTKVISNMRFYFTGLNLYAWTKWKGYDPEDDNNISLSEFPNPRTMTVGLDITF